MNFIGQGFRRLWYDKQTDAQKTILLRYAITRVVKYSRKSAIAKSWNNYVY